MPLRGRFKKVETPKDIRNKPGVYEFGEKKRGSQGRVPVYIGKTERSLRKRVLEHKGTKRYRRAIRTEVTTNPEVKEAKELASFMQTHGQLPRYNKRIEHVDNSILQKALDKTGVRKIRKDGVTALKTLFY